MNLKSNFYVIIIKVRNETIVFSCFKKERMEYYGKSIFGKCSGPDKKGRRDS